MATTEATAAEAATPVCSPVLGEVSPALASADEAMVIEGGRARRSGSCLFRSNRPLYPCCRGRGRYGRKRWKLVYIGFAGGARAGSLTSVEDHYLGSRSRCLNDSKDGVVRCLVVHLLPVIVFLFLPSDVLGRLGQGGVRVQAPPTSSDVWRTQDWASLAIRSS